MKKENYKGHEKRYDIEYIDSNSERQVHTGLNQLSILNFGIIKLVSVF